MNPFDAFLISMLALIGLSLATMLGIFVPILRTRRKRNLEVEALLEEVTGEEIRQTQQRTRRVPEAAARKPWERDPDWWKQ